MSLIHEPASEAINLNIIHPEYVCVRSQLIWLINYLSERRQFVQFDDIMSDSLTISTGVPQWSVYMSPIINSLYKNYIHHANDKFKAIIYAYNITVVGPL